MFDPSILKQGDAILYSPSSVVGYVIAIKTWSWVSHIEGYIGEGKSIGARPKGIDIYPLRNDKHSAYILRPNEPFDFGKAMGWFNKEAKGDKYDFKGLFDFYDVHNCTLDPSKQVCSVLMALWYQAGDCNIFAPTYPPNKISPAQFLQTPHMDIIWKKNDKISITKL